MGLIKETGAIVAGANCYTDISESDAYHSERGNSTWANATEAQKTAAKLAASVYLDTKYRPRWRGYRIQPVTQAKEWPRVAVEVDGKYLGGTYANPAQYYYSSTVVPPEIKAAEHELELRALSGPLAADISAKDRVKRKKVDVLETEYVATDFATVYQVVDQLVGRFLNSGNDAVRG